MINELRKKAAELLESGDVKVVIGYGEGTSNGRVTPAFITEAANVDKLIFDSRCANNLALYLKKPDVFGLGRMAIVAKGADARAINVLLLENQLFRDKVVILGVTLDETERAKVDPKEVYRFNTPPIYDFLFGSEAKPNGWEETTFDKLAELENMSPGERWAFWHGHFQRCIKCYACRQVCPICTCTRCITDKNQPQWVPSTSHAMGNMHWNITRAFHLAGRCISCGECQRACPMDIPLNLVNLKNSKEIYEQFGFQTGMNAEDAPPLATYKQDDDQSFIG